MPPTDAGSADSSSAPPSCPATHGGRGSIGWNRASSEGSAATTPGRGPDDGAHHPSLSSTDGARKQAPAPQPAAAHRGEGDW